MTLHPNDEETAMHRPPAAALGVASLAVTALVLAGCSTDTTAPAASTTAPAPNATATVGTANQADVEFAQMMIVHHQGALDMARLAADRAEAPEVKELAQRIEQAQQPEIETMTGWLQAWGAEPLDTDGAMPGMDHGSMSDTGEGGMASDPEMQQLQNAQGTEFDTLFLQLMTVHHQGAVTMAQTEVDNGQNTNAIDLAHQVVVDQTAEIALMEKLLDAS